MNRANMGPLMMGKGKKGMHMMDGMPMKDSDMPMYDKPKAKKAKAKKRKK